MSAKRETENLTVQEASRAKGFSDKTALLKRQQQKFDSLLNTILKVGNKEIVLHVCETEHLKFPVNFYAIKGQCTYKSGKREGQKYDCWVSYYGNYVGSIKTQTNPPITKIWLDYNKSTFTGAVPNFEWDETKTGEDRLKYTGPDEIEGFRLVKDS